MLTDSVFCYNCAKSINILTEKYFKLKKYNPNLETMEMNFDGKGTNSIEIFNAVWAFAVNEYNYLEDEENE